MSILAIDASTKRTGVALKEDNDGKITYSAIESKGKAVEERILCMVKGILQIVKDNNVTEVVLENPYGANAHTTKVLLWLQGAIVISIYEYNPEIQFTYFGASEWRSTLGIQGHRIKRQEQKQIDIDYINKELGFELTTKQDDEADSLGILLAYLKGAHKMLSWDE